jgi:hypothetical protein
MTLDRKLTARLVVVALTAAAGAAVARAAVQRRPSRPRALDVPQTNGGGDLVTCACGERYRSIGTGRHRVLWPDAGTQEQALMSPECSACGRPLLEAAA